jgi:hypothetical protein
MLPWKQPGLRLGLTLKAAGGGFLRVHSLPGEWRRIGLQPRIWQE